MCSMRSMSLFHHGKTPYEELEENARLSKKTRVVMLAMMAVTVVMNSSVGFLLLPPVALLLCSFKLQPLLPLAARSFLQSRCQYPF